MSTTEYNLGFTTNMVFSVKLYKISTYRTTTGFPEKEEKKSLLVVISTQHFQLLNFPWTHWNFFYCITEFYILYCGKRQHDIFMMLHIGIKLQMNSCIKSTNYKRFARALSGNPNISLFLNTMDKDGANLTDKL